MASTEMDYMNIGMGNLIGVDLDSLVHEFTRDSGDISTQSETSTWVATEDCILAGYLSAYYTMEGDAYVSIYKSNGVDKVAVAVAYKPVTTSSDITRCGVFVPVKRGQKIVVVTRINTLSYVKAYKPLY